MSTLKLYRVGMIAPGIGKTFVLVAGMGRAHSLLVARREHPGWSCTGEVEEMS